MAGGHGQGVGCGGIPQLGGNFQTSRAGEPLEFGEIRERHETERVRRAVEVNRPVSAGGLRYGADGNVRR